MKKNVRRVAGAVFLALAIALSQVPPSFVEAISAGTNFKMKGDTLISYTGTASVVSVPAGTKTIATDAFAGNSFLTEVKFPSSLETIENGAFRNCASLKEIVFPEGLETIESGAFSMCDSLSRVEFSDTILELGAGVFSGDNKLRTVILGDNPNFTVFNGVLYNRSQTKLIQMFAGRRGKSFIMPSSVTDIERYAFWGCKKLESVSLSAYLDEIPEYAFSNCTNLDTISIPYSVRSISAKAFEDCVSLEYIFLPASVTDIHSTAFDGCYQLTIDAQKGTSAYEFAQSFAISMAALMESDDSVSSNAIGEVYKDAQTSKSAEADEKDEEDDESSRDEDEDLDDSDMQGYDPANPADVSNLNVSDYYAQDSDDLIGKTRVVGGSAVVLYGNAQVTTYGGTDGTSTENTEPADDFQPDFIVPDNKDHLISKKSYYKDSSLKKVGIEAGIQKIDDFAFARSSVTEIVVPDGVTHMGYGAFYHCDKLKKIEIPATVTTIEPEVFAETPYLDNWKKGSDDNDFLVVGDGILIAYKGDASRVYIPQTVKKIAGGVFKNHPEITSVYLGDRVTEVGEDAFYGCTSLSEVEGGENVEKIADRAFSLCPLSSIHIPESVTEIGLGAFKLADPDAVVFEGEESLPAVSYEKTATRLENGGYRTLAFSDVDTFVIDNYNIDLDNTIADEKCLGFRGVVVTLDGGDAADSVVLVSCSLLPNEATGLVEVPSTVRIGGKTYSVTKALPNAFSAYETYEYWGGEEPVKGVLLPPSLGKFSDYEPELTFKGAINPDAAAEEDSTENAEDASVEKTTEDSSAEENGEEMSETAQEYVTTIVLDDSYGNAQSVQGNVIDDDSRYLLYVDTDIEGRQKLNEAVATEYGPLVAGQLNTLDLTMVDMKSCVPISNFGDTKVEIRIPVSEALMQQDICAVTLTDEGKLQTIYGTKETKDDTAYFVFKTNHFSTYGIYAGIGEVAEKIAEESKQLLKKDSTPDTGEDFNPKWLLVIFCGLIGLVLLVNKPIFRRPIMKKTDIH